LPYYYAGCKLYDILAGKENMESAYWMGKGKSLEAFPMLKGDGLVGGVVYYDGECGVLVALHYGHSAFTSSSSRLFSAWRLC
jgi:hypothetical protein